MPTVDFTDEELRLLVTMLTVEIQSSKFPLSKRTQRVRHLRDKLAAGRPEPPEGPATDA